LTFDDDRYHLRDEDGRRAVLGVAGSEDARDHLVIEKSILEQLRKWR